MNKYMCWLAEYRIADGVMYVQCILDTWNGLNKPQWADRPEIAKKREIYIRERASINVTQVIWVFVVAISGRKGGKAQLDPRSYWQ